jgi:hypothetical protein
MKKKRKRSRVAECFEIARAIVATRHPEVLRYGLFVGCPDCDREHGKLWRNFMHVHHFPFTVCSASAVGSLGRASLLGLFLHELGHVIGGTRQSEADQAIWREYGLVISYDGRGLQKLEM